MSITLLLYLMFFQSATPNTNYFCSNYYISILCYTGHPELPDTLPTFSLTFLSAHSDKPPRQFQPQVIHGLFLGLFGAAFCQVKVYRRADQRMFLAIGEAIAVQQIGLLPLGQPFQAIIQLPA